MGHPADSDQKKIQIDRVSAHFAETKRDFDFPSVSDCASFRNKGWIISLVIF
jgi:hypothetical protein